MLRSGPSALGTVALAILVACSPVRGERASPPAPAADASERLPAVVLISFDGTRPSDVTAEVTPRLFAFRERGAVAPKMLPATPTNTFPNHVTLATGVSPDRHGIVNNHFVDPERGRFDRDAIPEWIDVEPIWSVLAGRGIRSASFYWVGSEGLWRSGRGPADWKPFSSRTPESKKVDQIIAWLERPASERPQLVTSWFHGADHAGHRYGPGSEQVKRSLREQDAELGRLIDELDARGWLDETTLVIVSDHGMARPERYVDVGAALRDADVPARVYGIGGFATVVLDDRARREPGAVDRAVRVIASLGLEATARERAPAAMRVGNPRFGDVVVRAPVDTAIVYAGLDIVGFHGYPPESEAMGAIFMAMGRGVTPRTRLDVVRAVDVAPTVMALLGEAAPDWMEGRPVRAIVPAPGGSATLDAPAAASPPRVALPGGPNP